MAVTINTAELEQHAANFAKLMGETYAAAVRTAFSGAMTAAQERLGAEQRAFDAVKAEHTALGPQVAELKGQLATLTAQVTAARAQLADLEAKIPVAEQRLRRLESAHKDMVEKVTAVASA